MLRDLIKDSHGQYSHARAIALLVGVSATAFMWKLMVMGEMNETYFLYYLGYGVIHQNINKAMDVLNNFLAARQIRSLRNADGNTP
jgi:hypothetical protein